ncbi:hypothetical protein B7H01_02660 [Pandoraea apista]|nr:hypothetical protein B7H01_02660 [Pandoraea apista]
MREYMHCPPRTEFSHWILTTCSTRTRSDRADCSGLIPPDTHLGENARHEEVSDDQTTSIVFP